MKVNVEVTCTPEEARAFFGLPDLKPMQDRIMGEIEERLKTSLNSMNPEQVFKTWLPASITFSGQSFTFPRTWEPWPSWHLSPTTAPSSIRTSS